MEGADYDDFFTGFNNDDDINHGYSNSHSNDSFYNNNNNNNNKKNNNNPNPIYNQPNYDDINIFHDNDGPQRYTSSDYPEEMEEIDLERKESNHFGMYCSFDDLL
jgi:hypothetical protein